MTHTEQGQALRAAILAEPADDLHRLIYADWLEESGEEDRAEFIRANIELARRPGKESLFRMQATGETWQQMLPARIAGSALLWQSDVHDPKITEGKWGVRFRRGFVRAVRCELAFWLEHGSALVAEHPVEGVEVTDRKPGDTANTPSPDPWFWIVDARPELFPNQDWRLPICLAPHLPGCPHPNWIVGAQVARYPSRRAAIDALSVACLALARQRLLLGQISTTPQEPAGRVL